jgi:hypothetical protein
LLAQTDKAHENLNGAATRHVLHRALHEYGDERHCRLADISVSHRYNPRRGLGYREARGYWEGTKPSGNVSIALRKRPDPEGRAGSASTACIRAMNSIPFSRWPLFFARDA